MSLRLRWPTSQYPTIGVILCAEARSSASERVKFNVVTLDMTALHASIAVQYVLSHTRARRGPQYDDHQEVFDSDVQIVNFGLV